MMAGNTAMITDDLYIDESDNIHKTLLDSYKKNCTGFFDKEEYEDDLLRFVYVSRLLRKYKNSNTTNIRLLMNHIMILHNCFGELATKVLISYVEDDLLYELYAVLKFFSRLPPELMGLPYSESLLRDIEKNIKG